jgi:peptidoglycan hydrolase-like protein with peptidoglycan-binding domain
MTQVVQEIPPITMNLYTLPNPDNTQEYDIRKEKVNVTVKEASTVTEGIVCPRNRTPKLITLLQQALIKQGYPLSANGQYDQATQLSVTDYQKSKGLPYGDLTLGVLALLDVR